ncbi:MULTISPECIES: glycoside hydrolase family 65 protein [Sorangium]|uniref:Glycosyl hydrolase n=1 Tax=Sorangium cellulosum TaxID=56 RepID=A0A4P2QJV3_SORCE|nr:MULTISPECIES: glycosyl hydrolase family 65 protein [Sorangium]AUX30307.1 glycosyl hydrolase [Sorangium cellulosum]WCQ89701.1 Alpha,alpha-trehalose phosphorylase [Sorangium sp. Soce836]
MIRHEPVLPPEFIFPAEDWRMVERQFVPAFVAQTETMFATANGYLGMRGGFEEGTPAYEHGTFVNGFHETWPIPYGESAHGFATTGQTIVNVPDGKIVRLYVDDEVFDLARVTILEYERALDLRAGTLDRDVLWETPTGKWIRVRSRRLVSLTERHLAAILYEVSVLNARAPVVLSSELVEHQRPPMLGRDDPRLARQFDKAVLLNRVRQAEKFRVLRGYVTRSSQMTLACGMDHVLETEASCQVEQEKTDNAERVVFSIEAEAGKPIRLIKFVTYHTSRTVSVEEQLDRARRILDRAVRQGFDRLLQDQQDYLDDFWHRADVEVSGAHSRAQQSLRWDLFQLLQATARADGSGVPAKGLTGQAYEGHYFWDMEMYINPFLVYTDPLAARNLLLFRYRMLEAARQRAREVSQRGALYPWRTINGQEASAYYAASAAQYHINACVAHAIRKYVEVTGDEEFLRRYGAEMLVETARLWFDLGFFSKRQGGRFCIHSVTGPDEYSTVVDNNTYTNLMARENLRYAATTVNVLKSKQPDAYAELVYRTGLTADEPGDWQRAADAMYVAFDEALGIHPQDDDFLDHEMWDFENTPSDRYPMLLYYHPLVIYRHQVLKQPDVVLAMFLLGEDFAQWQKKQNFDYYDPLTTGDSSLSACIQSIVAAELGYRTKALGYWEYALLMDLADVGGNVKDGCHVAALGGSWMAAIYGFAGMRDRGGQLSFDPRPYVERLKFALMVHGQRLEVDMEGETITYLLHGKAGLTIKHRGESLLLRNGEAYTRDVRAAEVADGSGATCLPASRGGPASDGS